MKEANCKSQWWLIVCFQFQIMFQSENLQPFSPSLLNYMPNCPVRYHPPNQHSAHKTMFRPVQHHPQGPGSQCGVSGYGQKFPSRTALSSKLPEFARQKPSLIFFLDLSEHEKRHSEKFNAWNHPLMAIDCKKSKDGSRSSSPSDSGVSSQASTPTGFKYEPTCPRNSPHRYLALFLLTMCTNVVLNGQE